MRDMLILHFINLNFNLNFNADILESVMYLSRRFIVLIQNMNITYILLTSCL